MALIKFSEITFNGIRDEINRYLREEHNKAGILFSPASPYGHILTVIENLYQLSILYLKNSITHFDMSDPNANNPRIIRNAALYAGHIPGRAISSTGTLKLTFKTDSDLDDISGRRITIFDRSSLKNNTNGLDYSVNLGTERRTFKITPNSSFFLPVIQGKWKRKTFTANGSELFSIHVSEKGNKDVENFNVEVLVNGEVWMNRNHLYEMIPNEEACVVRTGFEGGIDIIFGNSGFGKIPDIGAIIEVNYLVSDGSDGNIFRRTRNDWKIVDTIIDGNGNSVDVEDLFNIDIYTDINFGADSESIQFTKNILPFVSNNFVLGLPQQYAYEIKKLGVFTHVNAYEKNNTIYIVATPDIRLFKNQNADYFNVDIKAFELDRYEKSKIDKYLKTAGNIQLTRRYRIDSPKLSYYVANVHVMKYSDATDDSVDAQIIDKISEYFLNMTRIKRIPKLDIIRELSSITDIHSIDIEFICKKDEDYHIDKLNRLEEKQKKYDGQLVSKPTVSKEDYDPSETFGLDPILGDILFEDDELPIIRGSFYDRNGVYYSEDMDGAQMKSINIFHKGKVDSRERPNT